MGAHVRARWRVSSSMLAQMPLGIHIGVLLLLLRSYVNLSINYINKMFFC
jgi:hypothetical protein